MGCLGAAAHCEMNGIYTSVFFVEMNVVPTSEGSSLVDGFTLLGSTLLHCGAVLRGL